MFGDCGWIHRLLSTVGIRYGDPEFDSAFSTLSTMGRAAFERENGEIPTSEEKQELRQAFLLAQR